MQPQEATAADFKPPVQKMNDAEIFVQMRIKHENTTFLYGRLAQAEI
jgi:hypothetical protein